MCAYAWSDWEKVLVADGPQLKKTEKAPRPNDLAFIVSQKNMGCNCARDNVQRGYLFLKFLIIDDRPLHTFGVEFKGNPNLLQN